MLTDAHDSEKLISVWIHASGRFTDDDARRMVAVLHETGTVFARKKESFSSWVIIVESDQFPDAKQRQQMAIASRPLGRAYLAVVNRSMLVRGVLTAMRWINRKEEYAPRVFATYEEARAWLVAETGYPPAAFDVLHAEARSKIGGTIEPSGHRA
ncbi:MAG TPA: STAS/SEC14 domain-containing protein [Polyangiaceae bacterium]|nr:STAS/SEC14 domain-containing protein [Polyangiaceae bacterium]